MLKSKLLVVSLILTLLASCIGKIMDDSIDLGNGYRYVQEPTHLSIIYQTDPNSNGSGAYVIPPKVEEYSFNKRFIIAKSLPRNELNLPEASNYTYWIIDKSYLPNLDQCMDAESCNSELLINVTRVEDSLSFKEILSNRGINLTFESWL